MPHRSAAHGPVVIITTGTTAKTVMIRAGERTALTSPALTVKRPAIGQRCSVMRSVNSAASEGAKLPATVITGIESSKGSYPMPARDRPRAPKKIQAMEYANAKKMISWRQVRPFFSLELGFMKCLELVC